MGDIQERIATAKKEAEELKDKIKQKKENLADTTCKFHFTFNFCKINKKKINNNSKSCFSRIRNSSSYCNESEKNFKRTFG